MQTSKPHLLTLPREIRDDIFSYLVLPPIVYSSAPDPNPYSFYRHNHNVNSDAYLDTRVFVPARAPSSILATSHQLRDEMLDMTARLINAMYIATNKSRIELEKGILLNLEKIAERSNDDGSFRITLEMQRPIRGSMGAYVPIRDTPSPRLVSMAPLLGRLRKIKFVVWGSWEWWNPVSPEIIVQRLKKAKLRAKAKKIQAASAQGADASAQSLQDDDGAPALESRVDPLFVAIGLLMKHFPLVEDISVDVLIHMSDLRTWDLPDVSYEGIRPWLDGPIYPPDGRRLKKAYRRLMVYESFGSSRLSVFYHKLEKWEENKGQSKNRVIHVSEGSSEILDEKDELPEEPPFTKVYDRVETDAGHNG
ncbi:hypothetical protein CC78DRAFT_566809 [Lojkania enalia]|uniref:Uncharacterized protein n=1 Tax=Lojkania enalia TaxID=147567 RepID=A0A9P4KD00_9PLEO|nr:hypothetical protein CC78DRAFT_566809 [Didymosphaeria enalia]